MDRPNDSASVVVVLPPESPTTSAAVSVPSRLLSSAPRAAESAPGHLETAVGLGQEIEEGNIEYKLKLINPTEERFEQLVTQLKWRLAEGQGDYQVGYEDSGSPHGLGRAELDASLRTLERMTEQLSAEASVVCERKGKHGTVAEVLVREVRDADSLIDLRLCMMGNVDSGKSTIIGVLTRGVLDDGRGKARLNVFTHPHEVETGRTSAVAEHILGFDATGRVVNYGDSPEQQLHTPSWSEIAAQSCKVLTLFDLAGHEHYLKTTIYGMAGHQPDYAVLLIGANMGVQRMTREHLGLALALKVPVAVVLTKIDIAPPNKVRETMDEIVKILKMRSVRKIPYQVKSHEDVVTVARNITSERVVPIFQVSSVTGHNLDLVRSFFNLLPPRVRWAERIDEPGQCRIDQTFYVTGVGTVASGTMVSGVIRSGSTVLLGPDGNGRFQSVSIKSIHVKRTAVREARAGQLASFAVRKVKRSAIRKGMVLMAPQVKPRASREFEADIVVLYHSTTIRKNYQPMVQTLTVRQSASIVDMGDQQVLRTGDKALVRFRFMHRPEYLEEGMRIIFREGRAKGIGIVRRPACDVSPTR